MMVWISLSCEVRCLKATMPFRSTDRISQEVVIRSKAPDARKKNRIELKKKLFGKNSFSETFFFFAKQNVTPIFERIRVFHTRHLPYSLSLPRPHLRTPSW